MGGKTVKKAQKAYSLLAGKKKCSAYSLKIISQLWGGKSASPSEKERLYGQRIANGRDQHRTILEAKRLSEGGAWT